MGNRIKVIESYLTLSLLEALPERFAVSKNSLERTTMLGCLWRFKSGTGILEQEDMHRFGTLPLIAATGSDIRIRERES
uniref:Uncharacterized protein n=1 Tax=Utricularia reniformis TaxID=192314 RepID=A0A1Y0AYS8_9LAMI|nr:hypothetical protein AEK19_MT0790 [Utricularia reniformis]ART30312.1 hypothetical protein AEK19_MT0790 [Utricularia reniformis]